MTSRLQINVPALTFSRNMPNPSRRTTHSQPHPRTSTNFNTTKFLFSIRVRTSRTLPLVIPSVSHYQAPIFAPYDHLVSRVRRAYYPREARTLQQRTRHAVGRSVVVVTSRRIARLQGYTCARAPEWILLRGYIPNGSAARNRRAPPPHSLYICLSRSARAGAFIYIRAPLCVRTYTPADRAASCVHAKLPWIREGSVWLSGVARARVSVRICIFPWEFRIGWVRRRSGNPDWICVIRKILSLGTVEGGAFERDDDPTLVGNKVHRSKKCTPVVYSFSPTSSFALDPFVCE